MQIIPLNQEALDEGRAAFRGYLAAQLCGRYSMVYEDGLARATGPRILPGAICACIEQGIMTEAEIVHAVARVSRCWHSTVDLVLNELTGADPEVHLWGIEDGNFYVHQSPAPRVPVLLVA
jgi:hypothetical protein